MLKKILLFLTTIIIGLLLFTQPTQAQVSCSEGVELNNYQEGPPESSIDSILTFFIRNAPDQFRNQSVYLQIKHPSGSGIKTEKVDIDDSGNAFVNVDSRSLNLSSGDYIYYYTSDFGLSGGGSPCSSSNQLTLTGDVCKNLGDSCLQNDSNFCNPDAECSDDGVVVTSTLSEFSFVCKQKNPPTCERCENFTDGSQECVPAEAYANTSCAAACGQQSLSSGSGSITCDGDGLTIDTAIGCIPIGDPAALSTFFLKWAVGIGGGIAFLLMLYAGFIIMTSTGNPEKIKSGQQLLTSAVAGLLMIVFSVFILRFIGIDLLGLSFG